MIVKGKCILTSDVSPLIRLRVTAQTESIGIGRGPISQGCFEHQHHVGLSQLNPRRRYIGFLLSRIVAVNDQFTFFRLYVRMFVRFELISIRLLGSRDGRKDRDRYPYVQEDSSSLSSIQRPTTTTTYRIRRHGQVHYCDRMEGRRKKMKKMMRKIGLVFWNQSPRPQEQKYRKRKKKRLSMMFFMFLSGNS